MPAAAARSRTTVAIALGVRLAPILAAAPADGDYDERVLSLIASAISV